MSTAVNNNAQSVGSPQGYTCPSDEWVEPVLTVPFVGRTYYIRFTSIGRDMLTHHQFAVRTTKHDLNTCEGIVATIDELSKENGREVVLDWWKTLRTIRR